MSVSNTITLDARAFAPLLRLSGRKLEAAEYETVRLDIRIERIMEGTRIQYGVAIVGLAGSVETRPREIILAACIRANVTEAFMIAMGEAVTLPPES